jgi:acylphosphatase
VTVHGRVQGVFFRDSVRERARSHGAVEAVFEGRLEDVERLVRFSETGPRHADVDGIDVREEEPEGLTGFEVR